MVPIEGDPIDGGTVLLDGGRVTAVGGPDTVVPDGAITVDTSGKWVLPGFIDAHTHLGVHEEAEGWAGQDTNEMTEPVTAARAGHGRDQSGRYRLRDAAVRRCHSPPTSTRGRATRSAA